MYNDDEIDAELVPQGTLAERMRAAGAGIGAFYTPASVGTELAEGKEHREINGRTYVLEYPLPAEYAFIRAWRADTFGNLAVSHGPAKLQRGHGHGRPDYRRRGGGRHRGAGRIGPGQDSRARGVRGPGWCRYPRTASSTRHPRTGWSDGPTMMVTRSS